MSIFTMFIVPSVHFCVVYAYSLLAKECAPLHHNQSNHLFLPFPLYIRVRPRFFDQVVHQTTNASKVRSF